MHMDRPLVTFLSDFGLKDAYVAQVKAVILSGMRDAAIVDISHEVEPYGILSAAWLLHTAWRSFPEGSTHLCVVDPGVGSPRGILAVRKEGHTFLGPDNGVFSFLFPAEEVIEVAWRPQGAVSRTFHGRDVFAPLVLQILKGADTASLGRPAANPVAMDVSRDMVVHTDRFGNLVTNIPASRLRQGSSLVINGACIDLAARTFLDIPEGSLALMEGSASTIEIAACKASAADILGVKTGTEVLFREARQRE